MKVYTPLQSYPNMEAIDIELYISNVSPKRVKISSLTIEKVSLLVDSSERYKIILTPGHTHTIAFSEKCRTLHLSPSSIKLEYVVEEEDIDQFSKASFLLPVIPAIRYNIENTALSGRVNSIWNNMTMSWEEIVTQKLHPDSDFFPNSKELKVLLPNLCESEELEHSALPAEEVVSNY